MSEVWLPKCVWRYTLNGNAEKEALMSWWTQHFQAGCQGKTPYDSPQAANSAKRFMETRRHGQHHRHVYHCPHCHLWHIGGRFLMKGDPVPLEKATASKKTLRVVVSADTYAWLMQERCALGISMETLLLDIVTAYRLQAELDAQERQHG